MKITKYILLILLFLHAFTITAQKVSNVTFRQEQSTIIISYDLETKTPCKISLFVSTDDGKTWQGALKKVKGDAGNKIVSGNYSITWNVLEEFEELRGDKIKFQVRADADDLETVIIGTQEWTVKNLNVSTYRNGDIIPEVKDPTKWANLKTGAWCYYNNDPKNGKVYGKLYNWYAVNDPRGLAPEGFHIPSDNEWSTLITFLEGEDGIGGKMMATGTSLSETVIGFNREWEEFSPGTNESGFTGLPGGSRDLYGSFKHVGNHVFWWSSSVTTEANAQGALYYINCQKGRGDGANKKSGLSVRCLRD